MFQKALTATSGFGRSIVCTPLSETVRQITAKAPAQSGLPVSACLSAEDDFELASEFLDVFTRASERVAGFVLGCTVIGIAWAAFSFL